MAAKRDRRFGLALLIGVLTLAVSAGWPAAPTAHAQFGQLQVTAGGPYSGVVGQAVFVSAQATINGALPTVPVTFQWAFGDGTTGTGQSTSKAWNTAGQFTVTVVATTQTGLTSFATTTATIGGSSQSGSFVVSAGGPYTGQPGTPISMFAQATINGTVPTGIVTYIWSFGDGTTGNGQFVAKTYTSAGNYTVTVTVTAASGQTGSATTTAQIGAGQTGTGTLSAGGPYTAQVGVPITMTAQFAVGSFLPGTLPQFFWNFGDGTSGTGQSVTKTYNIAGTFTITVTATTSTGQSVTATTTAQVGGQSGLVVSAGGPYSAAVGQPVTLAGTVSGIGFGISVNYFWDFGDGTTGAGQTATKTYAAAGTFTVTLSITTSSGQSGSGTTTVTVGGGSTGQTGLTEAVQLFPVCNNVALTWQPGTPITMVIQAINPQSGVVAIWRFNNTTQTFSGYSTTPGAPNDLQSVAARAEPVHICMNTAGTLSRPVI